MLNKAKLVFDKKNWQVSMHSLGQLKLPLVIIDNLYKFPESVRDMALALHYQPVYRHPGHIAGVSLDPTQFIELVSEFFADFYQLQPQRFNEMLDVAWSFTLLRDKKDKIREHHCKPHLDPLAVTGIIYLNLPDQCAGGTSFYRHRRTGIETVVIENLRDPKVCGDPAFIQTLMDKGVFQQFMKKQKQFGWQDYPAMIEELLNEPIQQHDHIRDSDDSWELMELAEMRWNRMILFPGFIFHSLYYADEWFGDRDEDRRLTQNVYFRWPKQT